MSLFKELEQKTNENAIEKTLAKSLEDLIKMLSEITEFSSNELKSLSLLQTDKYFQPFSLFYLANKKHLKRKHAKEILEALENIAKCITANQTNGIMDLTDGVKK